MTQGSQRITVELITDDRLSKATRDRLLQLLAEHDVSQWIFTDRVQIDLQAIPHSHPVLTMHTRHLGNDDRLLATFLHEQLHWFVAAAPASEVEDAFEQLRELFPVVPVGFPDGCNDEESTYLHLVVNYLELLVLRVVFGEDRARDVIEHWTTDHYRWVYRMVLEREADIRRVVEHHGLLPSGVAV